MSELYMTDSMQEMLDIDIKSEVTTVVGGVNEFVSLMNYELMPSLELDSNSLGTDSFFSNNALSSGGCNTDLYTDVGTCANPNYVMPVVSPNASSISLSNANSLSTSSSTSSSMSALVAAQSLLKSPKQNLTLNTTVHGTWHNPTLPSPKERKSHLTFSPNMIKVPMVVQEAKRVSSMTQITRVTAAPGSGGIVSTKYSSNPARSSSAATSPVTTRPVENVRKDLSAQMTQIKEEKMIIRNVGTSAVSKSLSEHQQQQQQQQQLSSGNNSCATEPVVQRTVSSPVLGVGLGKGNTIKLAAGIGGLTFANSVQFKNLKSVQKITGLGLNGGVLKRESSPQRQLNGNGGAASPKTFSRNVILQQGKSSSPGPGSPTMVARHIHSSATLTPPGPKQRNSHAKGGGGSGPADSGFPKPAYSYSCLIAMALKNSRSGSLPVSEIYSFMCEHFPYFKTAPNGWKNSVRHNLSLNKCFEKIEKPATNGGQRKGCLWAMNPSKITKMDEEVQKWSRKDPLAIRRAMVHPDNLEALERGEMKHGSTGDDDLDPEEDLESDGGPSDVDAEEVDEEEVPEPEEEEEEEADDVELIEQPHETIDVDAESFIINTPESLMDGDEDGADQVDFDLEVPDFYEDLNVDSKDGVLTMEFTQQDLLSLEDEDELLYIRQAPHQNLVQHRIPQHYHTQIISRQQQQQQQQPAAKRARLDVNYSLSPTQNGTNNNNNNNSGAGMLNFITTRHPTISSSNGSVKNGGGVGGGAVTVVNADGTLGLSFQQQFQLAHSHQQRQVQHQHSNNRRKMPMITRLA
ncbi:AGAP003940-PA-like protein [Anopheles sinensis]|uniref:AGAP003940-PA-like protein n=1 Tax=Anopheles sinensis TaxID=74873 RepID=A0A084WQV9_ANOSI|nr:AGAP003940-PA-like protein [Anopheles sinensis]